MATTTTNNPAADGKPLLMRYMGVGDLERAAIESDPRLYRELKFHGSALVLCTPSFGFAVANVAHSLLNYSWPAAICFGAVAGFGLYTVDKHFLVQARGAPEQNRRGILKVRFASLIVVGLSFVLLATDSFREDIERVLGEEGRQVRATLEQSPRYSLELKNARAAVDAVAGAAKRADDLVLDIAKLKVKQAEELEGNVNECQGNVVGNRIYVPVCGPKARGHQAEANRIGQEIAVDQDELTQQGDVAKRQAAAKDALAEIDRRIDQEVARATQGASKKLDAIVGLVLTNLSAALAVLFWMAVGMIPDGIMFLAQGRAFNHETFRKAREVQAEVTDAHLARARGEHRQRQTDGLKPFDVKLSVVRKPAETARPAAKAAETNTESAA